MIPCARTASGRIFTNHRAIMEWVMRMKKVMIVLLVLAVLLAFAYIFMV